MTVQPPTKHGGTKPGAARTALQRRRRRYAVLSERVMGDRALAKSQGGRRRVSGGGVEVRPADVGQRSARGSTSPIRRQGLMVVRKSGITTVLTTVGRVRWAGRAR